MMSGAWPPPAPSVWKLWIARPLIAAIESSMNPHSLRVSVWMAIWMSYSSATVRLVSMTARVVPQSSWSFRPQAPASIWSLERLGHAAVALAEDADVDRQPLERLEHPHDVPRAGRAGRRPRPGGRAGAAADQRGDAARRWPPRSAAGR